MVYQKVGRGGAGNFYSPQDIEEVQKRAAGQRDVEAQKQGSAAPLNLSDPPRSQPKYASSGRGGVGNVTDTSKLAAATKETVDVTPALQEARVPEGGHYGRGGAGNYRGNISGSSGEGEERGAKQQYGEGEEIEMGLRQPEKAHLGADKLAYDTPV